MRRTLGLVCAVAALVFALFALSARADDRSVDELLEEMFDGVDVDLELDDAVIIRVGEDVHLSAGQQVQGDVLVVNGDIHLSGAARIVGTAMVVGGDIHVSTGARVTNQAVAVNGDIHVSSGAAVEAEAIAIGGRVYQTTGGMVHGGATERALNDELRAQLNVALALATTLAPSYQAAPSVQPKMPVARSQRETRDINGFGVVVSIPPDLRVDGDVALLGGVLDVAGAIDGDVAVMFGHVRIFTTGEINGEMATFMSVVERDVPLERFGDLNHTAPPGVRAVPWHRMRHQAGVHVARSFAVVNLIILGSFGVVVLLFNLLLEPVLESAEVELTQGYVRSLLVGLLIEAVIPPLVVLLSITVVLIPLALLLVLAAALGATVAMGLVSRQLGRRVMGGPGSDGTLTRTLVGYLVLVGMAGFGQILVFVEGPAALAWTFSLLGYFVMLTGMTLGLGAVVLAQFGRWSSRSAPPPLEVPAVPTAAD